MKDDFSPSFMKNMCSNKNSQKILRKLPFINHFRPCLSAIYFLFDSQVHITPYKLNVFSGLSLYLAIFFAKHWTLQILRHWHSPSEQFFGRPHSTAPDGRFFFCLLTLKGFHKHLHKAYIPWSLARPFFLEVLLLCAWTTNFNMLISAFMA